MVESKKPVKKTTAAKKTTAPKASEAKRAAAPQKPQKPQKKTTATRRAVARPITRPVAPPRPRAEKKVEPKAAQPKREKAAPRSLPTAPEGHAPVIGADGASSGTFELPEALRVREVADAVLYQAFTAARSNARQATAATKNRTRVRGGGAKPWRQKGTGNARQGSRRAPHWRHGAVVFGPNGRQYWQRIPAKMRSAAFAKAFADQAAAGRVVVYDAMPDGEAPRTRDMAEWLNKIGDTGRTVIVAERVEERAARSLANLPEVELRSTGALQLADLLRADTVLVARGAIDALNARAGGGGGQSAQRQAGEPTAVEPT